MGYFSDVRQLSRNRRFDIVSQNSNEDGRKQIQLMGFGKKVLPKRTPKNISH